METIPAFNLALAFLPVVVVIGIQFRWATDAANSVYAVIRMLTQLMLVGYVLAYIFETKIPAVVIGVVCVMILISSWIALRTVKAKRLALYFKALPAIAIGGGVTLLLITQGVLQLEPWFYPNKVIPLAGMIFATAMTSISLAAERLAAEIERELPYEQARNIAYRSALIPITNSLFAVGLVSIPGMMTGQILSGESPLVAARYQIMVMCMVFGSAGLSAAFFLTWAKADFVVEPQLAEPSTDNSL